MISANCSLSSPGFTSTSMPCSVKIATAAGESLSEMRTRGVITCSPSAHPAQHMRERVHLAGRREAGLDHHSIELQQGHSDVSLGIEVLDVRGRCPSVTARVKHDGWVDLEMQCCRVRPGDGRNLVPEIGRELLLFPLRRISHRDMPGFEQEITWIGQARFVQQDRSMSNIQT